MVNASFILLYRVELKTRHSFAAVLPDGVPDLDHLYEACIVVGTVLVFACFSHKISQW